jgi:hypothetical protein
MPRYGAVIVIRAVGGVKCYGVVRSTEAVHARGSPSSAGDSTTLVFYVGLTMNKKLSLLTISATLLTFGLTGCATRSEVATIRTDAMETRRTADRALTIAEEANRRSERTEEMVNRSYRHSMRK